jgi:hypothetical protein
MRITLISILLNMLHFSSYFIFAQSGRVIPNPSPTSAPKSVEPPKIKEEYSPCETGLKGYIYISPRKIKEFTEELNRYGNCGYRLEKSAKIPLKLEVTEQNTYFFGVMKLDSTHKYEYEWFDAYSPGQTQTRMNISAERGFYFRENHLFRIIDDSGDGNFSDKITSVYKSIFGAFFIFERRNGEIKKNEYRVLDGDNGARGRFSERNHKKLNDAVAKGFRPVGITNSRADFAIIMEKDEKIKSEGEYFILNHSWGMNKKLRELTQTGFVPIFIGHYFALLKKSEKNPNPISFQVFYYPEKLLQKISKLDGVYYLMSGLSAGDKDLSTDLYFATSQNGEREKFEYKLHQMTNVASRPEGKDKYDALREPATAQMLAEFHNLLKQGYIIREILASKEIYILFERKM